MAYLIDTSVLSRLANSADTMYPVADAAITKLFVAKEVLAITAQNLIEFRNVATRPKAVNGLGLTTTEAESKAAIFEASFGLLQSRRTFFSRGRCSSQNWESSANKFTMPGSSPSVKSTEYLTS